MKTMMETILDRITPLAVVCGCMAAFAMGTYLSVLFDRHPVTAPDPAPGYSGMPPGWGLETNGEEWRWVDTDGLSWLTLDTKERALENAWEHYNYQEKQKTMKWRRVETPNAKHQRQSERSKRTMSERIDDSSQATCSTCSIWSEFDRSLDAVTR